MSRTNEAGAPRPAWPKDALRISFGVIWLIDATLRGFGGPYTSGASDIGTAVIYAIGFAGLLALSYYAGPARYSAGCYLEQKITWWWRIAELRRPASARPRAHSVPLIPAQRTGSDPVVRPEAQRRNRHPVAWA